MFLSRTQILDCLTFSVSNASHNGNTKAEAKNLWDGARKFAAMLPELRNPVASWTNHYQNKLNQAAIALLAEVGVTAEIVPNSHYPLVRIFGHDIAF